MAAMTTNVYDTFGPLREGMANIQQAQANLYARRRQDWLDAMAAEKSRRDMMRQDEQARFDRMKYKSGVYTKALEIALKAPPEQQQQVFRTVYRQATGEDPGDVSFMPGLEGEHKITLPDGSVLIGRNRDIGKLSRLIYTAGSPEEVKKIVGLAAKSGRVRFEKVGGGKTREPMPSQDVRTFEAQVPREEIPGGVPIEEMRGTKWYQDRFRNFMDWRLAGASGRRVTARTQARLDAPADIRMLQTTIDLDTLAEPQGDLTERELRTAKLDDGKTHRYHVLSGAAEMRTVKDARMMVDMLDQAERLFNKVAASGAWDRFKKAPEVVRTRMLQTDPDINAYITFINSNLGTFARAMGQRGALSEPEQQRVKEGLAKIGTALMDTKTLASKKFNNLRELFGNIIEARVPGFDFRRWRKKVKEPDVNAKPENGGGGRFRIIEVK